MWPGVQPGVSPTGHPWRGSAGAGYDVSVVPGGCRVWGVPRVQGAGHDQGYAHHTVVDECIYGWPARLGRGRAGAGTVRERCQEQCQDSARTVP